MPSSKASSRPRDRCITSVSPTSPALAGKFCTISVTWEALYTKYLIRNARLDESQLEKYCWEKYPQHQICRWYYPNGRKWRGTKEPPDEGEKVKKDGLNLNIQNTKIMASSPITLWQIEGGEVEAVTDYFLGLQNHCGLQWWWLPWNYKTLALWKET